MAIVKAYMTSSRNRRHNKMPAEENPYSEDVDNGYTKYGASYPMTLSTSVDRGGLSPKSIAYNRSSATFMSDKTLDAMSYSSKDFLFSDEDTNFNASVYLISDGFNLTRTRK